MRGPWLAAVWLLAACGPCLADAGAVFQLINQRLAFMEDVAAYKAANAIPVEDRARERTVIDKAKTKAAQAGLDAASTESFFRAQIAAAKAIQYRYLADWAMIPGAPARESPDLITEMRPELIRLGDEIVLAIKSFLEEGGRFGDDHVAEFLAVLSAGNLGRYEKLALYQSLGRIRLATP